jgi:hypothetical protein
VHPLSTRVDRVSRAMVFWVFFLEVWHDPLDTISCPGRQRSVVSGSHKRYQ